VKTKTKIGVTASLALSSFFVIVGGANAAPTDDAGVYSVEVKRDQPQQLHGRSVHLSARITSERAQTISSYVLVKTHRRSWLGSTPDSTDFAAGQTETIHYSAHHAGIRRALRHGHSRAAKLVVWVARGPNGIDISHTKVVRFQISPG
jgi:hypothetical protein